MDDFQYFSIKLHVGNHLNNCKVLTGVLHCGEHV